MHRSSFAPELSATLSRVSCWTNSLLRLFHDLEQAPALLLGDGARLGDADEVADAGLVLLVVHLEPGPLLHRLAVQPVGLGRADLDDDRLVHLVGDHGAQADLALAARQRVRGGRLHCFVHESFFSAFLLRGASPLEARGLAEPVPGAPPLRGARLGLGASSTTGSASTVSGSAPGSSSIKPVSATAAGLATAPTSAGSASWMLLMPSSRSFSTVMIRAMSWRTLAIWLEFSSWPTACLNRSSYNSRRADFSRVSNSSSSRTLSSS